MNLNGNYTKMAGNEEDEEIIVHNSASQFYWINEWIGCDE